MSVEDWKFELQRLFETFERESTISLRKINRCFEFLGRPFSDEFRRYFLKMSILRLDSSFDAILMERNFDIQMQMPSTSNAHTVTNDIVAEVNTLNSTVYNADCPSMPRNGSSMEWKIEKIVDATIEITNSDDDSVEEFCESQDANDTTAERIIESNASHDATIANPGSEDNDAGLNVDDDVEAFVKCEPKVERMDEMVDLPLVEFDPVEANESIQNNGSVSESMGSQRRARTWSRAPERGRQCDGNRFKCEKCAFTSKRKYDLKIHQLIHTGVKPFKCAHCERTFQRKSSLKRHQRYPERHNHNNELFKCTLCTEQFTRRSVLTKHLKTTHQNHQRLFNCGHCMRRFTQETEKDGHEAHCRGCRYECYLCKNYVTRYVSKMQRHMRSHSGARPFKCAICTKCFGQKFTLKTHLNSIHNRISK